jgi:glycosyltransferase involved in cell wall biosynthesis
VAEPSAPPDRFAVVANGDSHDPMVVSGVPYYFGKALAENPLVQQMVRVNAQPNVWLRRIVRLVSLWPDLEIAEQRYVHNTMMARFRSWTRDRATRHLGGHVLIHVRSWYYPSRLPYYCFIDATWSMLQHSSRSWTAPERTHRRRVAVEERMYAQAMHVFCASQDARASLVEEYGLDPSRATVVGNGINLATLPSPILRSFAEPALRVLFVGKDAERKGLPDLIQAIRAARAEGHKILLTIVGTVSSVDDAWVKNLGLVHDRSTMSALYREHDLLCLPSRQESFGLVVPEALAHSMPVIVSDVGELPRIVRHGIDGFVVPANSPSRLLEALRAAAVDRAGLRSMSQHAYRRAQDLTWGAVVQRVLDVIRAEDGSR